METRARADRRLRSVVFMAVLLRWVAERGRNVRLRLHGVKTRMRGLLPQVHIGGAKRMAAKRL